MPVWSALVRISYWVKSYNPLIIYNYKIKPIRFVLLTIIIHFVLNVYFAAQAKVINKEIDAREVNTHILIPIFGD